MERAGEAVPAAHRVGVALLQVEFDGRPHVKLEEGKEYTVRIVDNGKQGDGIARVAGMVVFVPDTKPGDEVRVIIERISRNCAFARKL